VNQDGSLADRRLFVKIGQVDAESGSYAYPDGLKMDSKGDLYIGHYSKGRILVVSPDKKLVKTIDVPSPAAPNLNFGRDESIIYIMGVDDQNNAPYWGKVYEVPNK
jgi:sugar lactone lactonase YvrE